MKTFEDEPIYYQCKKIIKVLDRSFRRCSLCAFKELCRCMSLSYEKAVISNARRQFYLGYCYSSYFKEI